MHAQRVPHLQIEAHGVVSLFVTPPVSGLQHLEADQHVHRDVGPRRLVRVELGEHGLVYPAEEVAVEAPAQDSSSRCLLFAGSSLTEPNMLPWTWLSFRLNIALLRRVGWIGVDLTAIVPPAAYAVALRFFRGVSHGLRLSHRRMWHASALPWNTARDP